MQLKEIERPEHVMDRLKEFNYTAAELEAFKEQASRFWDGGSPLGIRVPAKDYEDLADPICDFLLTEYQKYYAKEYVRRDKDPAPLVPIFICPRCDQLALAERVGRKKYCSKCSEQARSEKYRQGASPNEGRDYQFLHRLKKMDPALRKARLRQPKVKDRIAEIKARQKDSRRCQRLLLEIRLHSIQQS